MAEGWRAGDLAECIDVRDLPASGGAIARGGRYLRRGMIYLVRAVGIGRSGLPVLDVGAQFGPKAASRFRKVSPLADCDGALASASSERELTNG